MREAGPHAASACRVPSQHNWRVEPASEPACSSEKPRQGTLPRQKRNRASMHPRERASTAPGGQRQRTTRPSSSPQGRTPEERGTTKCPRTAVQLRSSWRHAALPWGHADGQKGLAQGPRPPARRPHTACQGHSPNSAAPPQARRPATAAARNGTGQGRCQLGAVQKQGAADADWLSQLWAEHGSRLQLHHQVWSVLAAPLAALPCHACVLPGVQAQHSLCNAGRC